MSSKGALMRKTVLGSLLTSFLLATSLSAQPTSLPSWDFTRATDRQGWQATHHLGPITGTADGMVLSITGSDPYTVGPARDYPEGQALWLRLQLKSDQGGMAQIFYFNTGATEENSVRFVVPGGEWHEAKVRMPALGAGYQLRVDPPGTGGKCLLGTLRFEPRIAFQPPAWPAPAPPQLGADALTLESGDLALVHGRRGLGEFEVHVAGRRLAVGNTRAMIGYLQEGQLRWFPFGHGPGAVVTVEHQPLSQLADALIGGAIRVKAACPDPDGGSWQIEQTFALNDAGTLRVSTRVVTDADRDVLYLPAFTLLAGLGDFGTNKTQALLAGVEYLDNEPSSSAADLNPPASNRQVPDIVKLTFPLMAVAAQERYVALAWNRDQPNICAVFDSPDRFFGTASHLMGLLFPGSDGANREENSLLPYDTVRLAAHRSVTVSALLLGGQGTSVVPAVQQYVRLFGLPPVPDIGMSAPDYFVLAARGWLDSQVREGDRYRHAAAPNFGATASADAAFFMDWLAPKVGDAALAARLLTAAQTALALVPSANYNSAQIGHVRYPVPALVYGAVAENANASHTHGNALLSRFQPDGSVHYQKPASGLDYGRTHWAPDANGLTAGVLQSLLDEALFSGNRALRVAGLRHLRALDKFRDTVPRGAQTWEIPLHTPDILASAYLVRVYTMGYEMTRDPALLDQARYWAWTGVPFVYLSPPTVQPVGVYSTIAVLGATAWVAPNWIGLPVQWCGLVYADALHRLVRHDPGGPWKQIADGIAAAGIQHSYPIDDPQYRGLLPDSYNLRPQSRNGPAINPATLLAPAVRLLEQPPLCDFAAFNRHALFVHAPGEIADIEERADGVRFTVKGWSPKPYRILVNGLARVPEVAINGQPSSLMSPHQYQAAEGRLILQLSGTATVNLAHPALARVSIEAATPHAVKVSWPAQATGATLEAAADLAND